MLLAGGPRLGDFEAGVVAAVASPTVFTVRLMIALSAAGSMPRFLSASRVAFKAACRFSESRSTNGVMVDDVIVKEMM